MLIRLSMFPSLLFAGDGPSSTLPSLPAASSSVTASSSLCTSGVTDRRCGKAFLSSLILPEDLFCISEGNVWPRVETVESLRGRNPRREPIRAAGGRGGDEADMASAVGDRSTAERLRLNETKMMFGLGFARVWWPELEGEVRPSGLPSSN